MEISPIAGIRAMPVLKPRPTDTDLAPLFDIENTSGMGDETWSHSPTKLSRGSEDDSSEDDFEDPDIEDDPEPAQQSASLASSRQISLFA